MSLALIKSLIYLPLTIPAVLVYFSRTTEISNKINMDTKAYWIHTKGPLSNKNRFFMWYRLITGTKEFRNVFYCRCGKWRHILSLFLKPVPSLYINPFLCHNYEGGLYISHGTSSQVYANRIGKNLWMHHNVTLGMIGEGRPEIGDNVYIGTGAIVLGGVKIGNNVKIGAGAIVVNDIPDNCTVCSPKAKIVKYNNFSSPNVGGGGNMLIHWCLQNTA